jgi:hypothetical protein
VLGSLEWANLRAAAFCQFAVAGGPDLQTWGLQLEGNTPSQLEAVESGARITSAI